MSGPELSADWKGAEGVVQVPEKEHCQKQVQQTCRPRCVCGTPGRLWVWGRAGERWD